jgi:hypothetical protein
MTDLAAALSELIAALEQLKISYAIGGSLASSSRGKWRSTDDVDIVSAMPAVMAERLSATLGAKWYAEPEAIRHAIGAGRSFNVIHIPTSYKFDLFPATSDFHVTQLQRGGTVPLALPGGTVSCRVVTAEDILLAKLRWYRDGGEISERQWTDIYGIVAMNPNLDLEYTRTWAAKLGVTDLLDRALAQSS